MKKLKEAKSEEEELTEGVMPLGSHLSELRKRLLISIGSIFVAFIAVASVEIELGQPILTWFREPLSRRDIPLVFDELTEPFFTYLRIGIYAGLFLTFPITLTQIWLFIKPALYQKEKHAVWPFLILSYPLFIGGGLFGYFVVLPFGYDFFLSFQNSVILPSLQMGAYLSLTIHILFVFGLVFELPIISLLLTRMGIIDAPFLRRNRKYAIVLIFILAAVLTPPDLFTQGLMAVPLIILYEIGIIVSAMTKKSKDLDT